MNEVEIYATTIVAILGIAYPLVLQVISKLDDTYGSTRIIELFESEWVRRWFPYQLYASLFSVFLWSLKLEPLYPFKELGYIVDNSGTLLVICNTILLVVAFILLVNKLFVYSTTSSIARYLMEKHNERH